jgi:hypothetical protein
VRRFLGLTLWRRILLGARDRPWAGWRSISGMDRRRPGGRCGRRRFERIGAGLYGIGVPRDGIVTYEATIKAGQYLVVAHGTSAEAAQARSMLSTWKPADLTDHVLEPAGQAVTG